MIKDIGGQFKGISGIDPTISIPKKEGVAKSGLRDEFSELLNQKLKAAVQNPAMGDVAPLKFSKHAIQRIQERGISLQADEILDLTNAVQSAREKGSKEALILTPKAAFVVSIKNGTVVTAVDRNAASGNVFTNIDSTIVI